MSPIAEWYETAVFYEIYLRSFADGNADGIGDLSGLIDRLDYLVDLGIDCLWLQPFFPSPLRDDGYDVADYCDIHPDYGTLNDFDRLLTEAHARQLRVIVDLVPNHTSDQHAWFQQARADRNSPYRPYYVWSDDSNRYSKARIIFLDSQASNWTWDPLAGQYYWHRFFPFQPDLNFDCTEVQEQMLRVLRSWLERGVDGFRVDAVPYLVEREGTDCENLPETHAFLKRMRALIDEHYPGRVLLAEANQRPMDLLPYFGQGDEFQMAFNFPLMPRIFEALKRGSRTPIEAILSQTPTPPPGCQWCTFLRNHDELTLEMVEDHERAWMWSEYAPEPDMRLNLGIRRRLAPLLDGDRRKVELAHSLLLTLAGTPILYYGDEIGMGDDTRLEDRRGLRTPMQWSSAGAAGFTTGAQPHLPPIATGPFAFDRVNVAAQVKDPTSLWQAVRRMLAIRKQSPALTLGTARILPLLDPALLAIERRQEDQRVVALHNLGATERQVNLTALSDAPTPQVQVIVASEVSFSPTSCLNLPAFSWCWLLMANG